MKIKKKSPKKETKKASKKQANLPTLKITSERDIGMDFAQKVYTQFDKLVKSIILFGSTTKETRTTGSDIDIIIIVDDASIQFDQKLIAWYREELGKIISNNPYKKELHINTVKLTTWWQDLMRGDPIVINIIRYGEAMIDFGGFFTPLKSLLEKGKIKATPEAIYTALERSPQHLARSKQAELSSVEGVYWAMVDSAHALLIAAKVSPPSPEKVPEYLVEYFVKKRLLDKKYVLWYKELYEFHRKVVHGQLTDVRGQDIDMWQDRADEFIRKMASLIDRMI
jgi:uncharacterized protein (UPF0332 family)/predicted nucleotidyltransferase